MSNKLFSPLAMWQGNGLAMVRIITGLLLLYHGLEVFDAAKMKEYGTWDTIKGSVDPLLQVYAGKASEFITGLFLALGLFTRITSLWIVIVMGFITFFVGNGKFWYEDQHPFLFVLLSLIFFFTGPGKWSIDSLIFKQKDSSFNS